jgi:hypothetical protein
VRTGLNRTTLSQTLACIAKSSYAISAPLRYYAVLSGNSSPTFRDNLLVPSSRVKKAKRENREWEVNWHNFLFWRTCQSSNFLKMHDVSEAGCFHFQEKKHPTWWTPCIGHLRNTNLLRYVFETRSSPSVVTGKWLLKIKN